MIRPRYPSFRSVLERGAVVRVAGAHCALVGLLARDSGFDAVWASSFEISAAHGLPDSSLLTMTEYLTEAAAIQKMLDIPVVADCDTGFGDNLNVVHMVHEYERAGITAVCIEDKIFPKMNSFAENAHTLLNIELFCGKIRVAKQAQSDPDFFVIARTEALISGLGIDEALRRARAYEAAGADAVLIHSKARSPEQIEEFLAAWDGGCPVVIVPTTYPDWHVDDAAKAGVSVVIYANQGLRATVGTLRSTFGSILEHGSTAHLEGEIPSVQEIFALQQLADWQKLGA
ncbi:MAG: isocitrate lyase/phosphoenolpyruvate mutase family protein [Actinomycetota bacterium]|nr:isocitrate lyase/phosphoenolpyruvate mutase family protein [Actinomycetota bacterium]MDQ2956576.1 isocitrate lyase/phosphoenolpyruvate mutase family protein [Actinomycetota bacterium]